MSQWANEPHLKYSIHWKILTQSLNIIARKGELLIVGKNWQQIYGEETKVLDRQFTGCRTDWTSSDESLLQILCCTLPMEYKSAGKQCMREKWQKIRLCSKFKLYICTSFRQHSVTFPSLAVKFFLKLFQKNYFVSSISNPTLKFAKVSLMWANHWTVSSGRVQSFFYSEIFSKTFSVSAQSVNPPTGIPTKAPKCNVADWLWSAQTTQILRAKFYSATSQTDFDQFRQPNKSNWRSVDFCSVGIKSS